MTETTKTRRPRKMAREAQPVPNDAINVATAWSTPVSGELAMPAAAKPQTKANLVQELLARDGGASLAELCEATSWLPHTCRAFLTGLRKRGRSPEKGKRDDGITVYHLPPFGGAA